MRLSLCVVVLLAAFSTLCSSFDLGANLPWVNYGTDFGRNAWGVSGIATNPGAVNSAFSTARSNGATTIRVWLFADARAGIVIDGGGNPTGLDGKVFGDMDAIIQSARNNGVQLVFVFFDFILANWYSINNNVQMGGRTSWITDSGQRAALINNVVRPVLQRYANEPTIAAWEIMNEPEWIINDLPWPTVDTSKVNAVNLAQFYAFASAISSAVHSYSSRPCTLGSATLKWHVIWTNSFASSKGFTPLNLDFYQTHYYSWMDNNPINDPVLGTFNQSPMQQSYNALNLDKAMVVGEFGSGSDITNVLNTLKANGYSGAWAWSINADYTITSGVWSQMHTWVQQNGVGSVGTPLTVDSETPDANSNPKSGGDGLSAGGIAGITIASVVIVLAAVGIVTLTVFLIAFFIVRRRRLAAVESLNYVQMTNS